MADGVYVQGGGWREESVVLKKYLPQIQLKLQSDCKCWQSEGKRREGNNPLAKG